MTCPSICAVVLGWMNVKMCVKTSSSETPITISGVTRGKSMMKFETPAPRPRQRASPSASKTPIGVAMSTSEHGQLQALDERVAQVWVVPDRVDRIAPVPARREPRPDRARPAGVERELHGDQDRDDRPRHVEPGEQRPESAAGPRGSRSSHADAARSRAFGRDADGRRHGHTAASSLVARCTVADVVAHQNDEEQRQDDRQRRADRRLRRAVEVEVDLVPEHRCRRRTGDDVGRVVVAEHRERDQHAAAEDAGLRERQRDVQERPQRARTEITGRLELALVDPVERGVERQDEVGDVPVDECEDAPSTARPSRKPYGWLMMCAHWRNRLTNPSGASRFTHASMRIR